MPGRILIIEDNWPSLELMSYLLRAFGHAPLPAWDGEAGLEAARRERPDLILCDIQLPGLDGHEVARRLKSDPSLKLVPLVAVTALAMVGDREKILASGFDGYVGKPIEPEKFVQQVEAFLPVEVRSARPPPAPSPRFPPSPPVSRGCTILVVDNLETNLELARSTLEGSGYRVVTAERMRHALLLAQQEPPDLIMSDICMSEGNGYDFIQEVKADPRLCQIPFVFITSTMVNEVERRKGLGLGAARFLFRPIEPERLLAELDACLSEPRIPRRFPAERAGNDR